jgi:DNA-directed RNA polymerase specialized sigma24 family protein
MSNYWNGLRVMNPNDMERFFSEEDTLGNMAVSGSEFLSDESEAQVESVRKVLDRLPPREADFVELYFFKKVRQTTIAALFNVSQPTICYRLQRAAARIKYLLSLPELAPGELEKAMRGVLSDDMDIRIMVGMAETTCQSEVAKSLGVSQGLVRHRFFRTLNRIKALEGMDKYVRLFQTVADNLNIMREVYRAEWDESVIHFVM